MTWLLINTELRYSSLNKIKEAATSRNAKIVGEWSDEQVEQAVKNMKNNPENYIDMIDVVSEFLPQPISDAL